MTLYPFTASSVRQTNLPSIPNKYRSQSSNRAPDSKMDASPVAHFDTLVKSNKFVFLVCKYARTPNNPKPFYPAKSE